MYICYTNRVCNQKYLFLLNQLQSFVDQYFTSHNCAIIGMGVDHEFLTNYAGSLPMEIGSAPPSQKAKYSGGEYCKFVLVESMNEC